jgi:hypothetical protein
MKKYFILFVFLFCFSLTNIFAQSFYEILGTSHYTRAIRLGNSFAGVAEGTETIFYNVAGLANLGGYSALYSNGQGFAFIIDDARLNDFALAFQLPENIGTAALSLQSFTSPSLTDDFGMYLFSISTARKLFNDFSAGITLNYYYETVRASSAINPSVDEKFTASTFDINLGLLYELPSEIKINEYDKLNIGFQIKNLLNNEIKFEDFNTGDNLFQEIRFGIGYLFDFQLEKIGDFNPLTVQLSADAVFQGADYDFTEWQPNYGIEITAIEIIQLSFGRENENQIKKTYDYSPQHPVNRYGVGINIPVEKIIDLPYKCHLNFNYCISDWQKIDEDEGSGYPFYIEEFDKNSFSVGVVITP